MYGESQLSKYPPENNSRKILVVGISSVGEGAFSPDGASGRRLASILGVSDAREVVDTDNLWDGDPEDVVRRATGRRVVAMGRRVASYLGASTEWFRWTVSTRGFVVAACPHPSGLSRMWNDPLTVERVRGFLVGSMGPCIHVEGPDGSGKSTLVPLLAEAMNLRTVGTQDPPSSWDECLARIEERVAPGIVCDRSSGLVSELVYGPVLRGRTVASEEEMMGVVRAVSRAVTIVYCRPARLLPRRRLGEDEAHTSSVEERLDALRDRYDEVMENLKRVGMRVVEYDYGRGSVGEVARRCAE